MASSAPPLETLSVDLDIPSVTNHNTMETAYKSQRQQTQELAGPTNDLLTQSGSDSLLCTLGWPRPLPFLEQTCIHASTFLTALCVMLWPHWTFMANPGTAPGPEEASCPAGPVPWVSPEGGLHCGLSPLQGFG